ncbi:MAG: ATP-binding protein [Spirochaetes bacterium]|nr:MAG: ATP-binding protein [Spirochaetota bacterium]
MNEALVLPNRCRDAYAFEEIIKAQDPIYARGVSVLDLSRIDFIEPYSMLGLLLLGRTYLRNTGHRLSLTAIPLAIHQYLSRMDFFKWGYFDVSQRLEEGRQLKRSAFSNRVVEITEISHRERESIAAISAVIGLFRKRAEHILKYWVSESTVDYFVTVISEVCQNIFEHSLDSGYCALQTYSAGGEHVLRLVISDSGIGIPASFASRPDISGESNARLIEMALTTPISSKRKFGYGLCQVNDIVEKLRGGIFMRSDHGSVAVMYNKKRSGPPQVFLRNDLTHFPGTQISISLFG